MIFRDELGNIIPPGTVQRDQLADFDSQALPSWLTLAGSSVATDTGATTSFADPTTALPAVTLTTAATANNTATLQTPSFDASLYECVRISLGGFTFGQRTATQFRLGFWCITADGAAASHGARLETNVNGDTLFRTQGTTSYVAGFNSQWFLTGPPTGSNAGTGEWQKQHNAAFWLFPRTKWIYATEGDHIIQRYQQPNITVGPGMFGRIQLLTTAAAAAAMTIQQINVTRWSL